MKKKVLILNHGLHIAGVSRTLVSFANELVKQDYDVTLKIEIDDFTLKSELDPRVKCSLFLKEWRIFGIRIPGFLRFYNWFIKNIFKCSAKTQYKAIVRKKYDVEIAYNRGAAARIISGSTNKKAKHLVWVHSDYMRNDNPLAGFESLEAAKNGYSKFDKIVCVSEQAECSFKEKFGDNYPITTRYNIVDIDRINKLADEKVISKNKFTVAAVGRLCEAKNYGLLLDAAEILKNRGYDIDFWVVGGGNLEKELTKMREDKNLDNVKFLGAKVNPYPYIKWADLYVSSSIYEGLSTTTIEAIVLKKPCVVTDCTGMRNILGENNEYGVIVPIEKEALAHAIEKMIIDENYRAEYSKKAKKRAADFDSSVTFKRIEELF